MTEKALSLSLIVSLWHFENTFPINLCGIASDLIKGRGLSIGCLCQACATGTQAMHAELERDESC